MSLAAAASDHATLARAKLHVAAATSRGGEGAFDNAVREAFASNDDASAGVGGGGAGGEATPAPMATIAARGGSSAANAAASCKRCPCFRFYAVVSVTSGFRTTLRSPAFHDLEAALRARRRLAGALGAGAASGGLRRMTHGECTAALAELRREYTALHEEHGGAHPVADGGGAGRAFRRVEKAVLDDRDAASTKLLRQLLITANT